MQELVMVATVGRTCGVVRFVVGDTVLIQWAPHIEEVYIVQESSKIRGEQGWK